ncbi:MAG: helix-turn-helix transcriptional regulator [Kiritimatiellae bacterium]|nr:helix-turn-helix transcriptional regulator [Kiritimatiellia bacterium]
MPVPLGARSVGHYVVEAGYAERPIQKWFVQVFWGIRGRGQIVIDGEPCMVGPDQIAAYFPGDWHRVSSAEDWEYRWWTLDGPHATEVARSFGLSGPWPCEAGACPQELFAQLEQEIRDEAPFTEFRASATAYRLLTLAAGRKAGAAAPAVTSETLADRCVALIRKRYADPALCVDFLARALAVHRSRLSREFRRRFGVPPVAYIHSLRLQRGFSMLRETDATVTDIARQVGFVDPAYFSRCVSHTTGMCPRDLRSASRKG